MVYWGNFKLFIFDIAMAKEVVRSKAKLWLLMGLGLLFPIFLVGVAFLASSSDAKNQRKYQRQELEQRARIKAREEAEQLKTQPTLEEQNSALTDQP